MVAFISIGKCDRHFLFPLGLCFLRLLKELVQHYKGELLNDNNKPEFVTLLIILSVSKIMGSLLLITSKQFAKSKRHVYANSSYYFKIVINVTILLISSVGEYFLTLLKYYYYQFQSDNFTENFDFISSPLSKSFMILFLSLLSYWILKEELYSHKKFALFGTIIAVALFIIVLIFNVNNISTKDQLILRLCVSILLSNGCSLADSIKEILEKYLMNNKFIFPFLILLTEGLIQIIFVLIFNVKLNFLNKESTPILSNLRECWLYFLIFFIISMFLEICRIQSNYFFGPVLRTLSDSIAFSIFLFINEDFAKAKLLPYGVSFSLITFIFTLVYTEIIILHFCGFDNHTKGNLYEEAKDEIRSDFDNLDKYQQPEVASQTSLEPLGDYDD